LDVSDSFNPSTPSNEPVPGPDVQEVRMEAMSKSGLIPIVTSAIGEAQFNVAESSQPMAGVSIPKSAGAACRANEMAFRMLIFALGMQLKSGQMSSNTASPAPYQ
jgi:hypothetical protein